MTTTQEARTGSASASSRGTSGMTGDDARAALTRYLMFRTDDDGRTLAFLGAQDAKNSDEALRLFHGPDTVGTFAAVSENHFKLRPLQPRRGPVVGAAVAWPETIGGGPAEQADPDDADLG